VPKTPEGVIKLNVARILAKSQAVFGVNVFFWYNASTGVWDRRTGAFRRNTSPYAILGVADILGVLEDGTFLAIEVKSAKGRLSEHQKKFLKRITDMRGIALVVYSSSDFVLKFNQALLAKSLKANYRT